MIRKVFFRGWAPSLVLLWLAMTWHSSSPGHAQDKKKGGEKKQEPRIVMTLPLGAAPGKAIKVTIRGVGLENATAVKTSNEKIGVKLLSKGKATVPDKIGSPVGDTQVVVELSIPADLPPEPVSLTVINPDGPTRDHKFHIDTENSTVQDKEPNDGFKQAQPIKLPQIVHGFIDKAKDVDVFKFEGNGGQKIVAEVFAARLSSPLDAAITLYDETGQQVASSDDAGGSIDPMLKSTLPRTGTFYLALIDTHETGGPLHIYRLMVQEGR